MTVRVGVIGVGSIGTAQAVSLAREIAGAAVSGAQAELRVLKPDPARLTDAEIYAMVDALGDVGPGGGRTGTTTCRGGSTRLR